MRNKQLMSTSALAAADASVLAVARPHFDRLALIATAPAHAMTTLGPDRFVADLAGAGLWLVAVWVAVGLLVVTGARLPGLSGRACRSATRLVLPAVARRILVGSAGLGLALAPGVASAAPAGPVHPAVGAVYQAQADGGLSPGRPGPAWPTAPSTTSLPTPGPPLASQPDEVRVRAGDSLWLLAGHRLGPGAGEAQVAAYWPRIYAANRAVIGRDPDLITPGQRLQLPDPTTSLPHRSKGATP